MEKLALRLGLICLALTYGGSTAFARDTDHPEANKSPILQTEDALDQAQTPQAPNPDPQKKHQHTKKPITQSIPQTLQPKGQAFNAAGQAEDQLYQARGSKEQAAGQVEESTEQSISQGLSQSEELKQQLRSESSSIAADEQQMVSSTKA